VIKEKLKIIEAIQVCWSLYNPETKTREINGLIDALSTYKLKRGTILTDSEEDNLHINGFEIEIKPVWKWLLLEKLLNYNIVLVIMEKSNISEEIEYYGEQIV
jgi:hypothetical protein